MAANVVSLLRHGRLADRSAATTNRSSGFLQRFTSMPSLVQTTTKSDNKTSVSAFARPAMGKAARVLGL